MCYIVSLRYNVCGHTRLIATVWRVRTRHLQLRKKYLSIDSLSKLGGLLCHVVFRKFKYFLPSAVKSMISVWCLQSFAMLSKNLTVQRSVRNSIHFEIAIPE